jgi:hypothetical protein
MSAPTANCPNCGAPVQFRWSSAAQAACPYCHSILVRTDVKIEAVGKIADLPPDPSPIQLLTEGVYKGDKFQVTGRLVYEYEQGGWNEWHILFSKGNSGWLSDAQLQYAVSFLSPPSLAMPAANQIRRGEEIPFKQGRFEVATITRASYKGFEGELPFPYYTIGETMFADLRTSGPEFATIDYSEDPPLLFVGEWVEFESLNLKNLRQFEGWV